VETADALRMLVEFDCDAAQGYHISRPVAAEAIVPLLRGDGRTSGAVSQTPGAESNNADRRSLVAANSSSRRDIDAAVRASCAGRTAGESLVALGAIKPRSLEAFLKQVPPVPMRRDTGLSETDLLNLLMKIISSGALETTSSFADAIKLPRKSSPSWSTRPSLPNSPGTWGLLGQAGWTTCATA